MDVEQVSAIAVDCGLKVHKDLGPGMLESAYEAVLSLLRDLRVKCNPEVYANTVKEWQNERCRKHCQN